MIKQLVATCTVGVALVSIGCRHTAGPSQVAPESASSVWSVDLVRTLPGAQADYIRSIQTNWAGGRKLARAQGVIRSYRALAAPPDSARGWDVLLMTEYADSASYLAREAIFQSIFASPKYVRVEPARPSAQMRTFTITDVAMRAIASESGR